MEKNVNRTRLFLRVMLCFAAALTLGAGANDRAPVLGTSVVHATQRSPLGGASSDVGLVTIFNNLAAYAKGKYWAFEGSPVVGPSGSFGPENWRAAAFTPVANHVATVIRVAAAWVSGTNGLVLSLNHDNNGVPGKAMAMAQLRNLPTFGTCCVVEALMDGSGVALAGGSQYWVVLSTNSAETNTNAVWDFNDTDQVDSRLEASYCPSNCGPSGAGWTPYQSDTVTGSALAYAVLGSS